MSSSHGRSSDGLEDQATSQYLREYQELISFALENGSSFEEIKRRVDDFYDQYIFEILRDYERQFMFTLVTLKVYSVFRAGVRGDISSVVVDDVRMVRRERIDFRAFEKSRYSSPMCGESHEEWFARVHRDEALKKGYCIPLTVFVRRKDSVVKELPRFYDDMMFTYDGARIEKVLDGVDWSRVRHGVRQFVLEGINRVLHDDAKLLSLVSGDVSELDGLSSFEDGVSSVDGYNPGEFGWLDCVRKE
ncbi:hypothetical protein LV161_008840, partial [Aspergillus fumigatus]